MESRRMSNWGSNSGYLLTCLGACSPAVWAGTINDPFHDDPAGKLEHKDASPVGGLPPIIGNWLSPGNADMARNAFCKMWGMTERQAH